MSAYRRVPCRYKAVALRGLGLGPALAWLCGSVADPRGPAVLDMAPAFDLAGAAEEVCRASARLQLVMPGVGLRFSMLQLAPAAGPAHVMNAAPFEKLGCQVQADGKFEVFKSPWGGRVFARSFAGDGPASKWQVAVAQFLGEVGGPQATRYLFTHSVAAGRVSYLALATPAAACA